MDKRSICHVDTMSGLGHLLVESATYQVSYTIKVFQDFSEIQDGEPSGLKKMHGYLQPIDDRLPALFNLEEAILELADGRKIRISLSLLPDPKGGFEFTLRDEMDLRE